MWKYNYTQYGELYHHGILGMKWGIRRYQNANGSLTAAGRRRNKIASPTKVYKSVKSSSKKLSSSARDTLMFGPKGADRIAKRQEQGKSRRYAVNVERAKQLTTGFLTTAALATTANLLASGKGAELVSKGVKAAKNMWNSQFDSMLVDASGKVLGRYRNSVKDVVMDMVVRR